MAERQFGPYRLVRQIAVGGMAEIHLAKTKGIAGFEKYVALKMIHPNFAEDDQFIQMLVDEAKIAVQLTHGNIAQTFDLGRVGDTYYITMEYVDGADLYKILRRASEMDVEMPLDVCAFIGKEITSALDHAHRKRDNYGKPLGIVHRDVSPQNVLISYSGEVKLVDFGIAKATMKARQTAVGVIKGKYYYMSPEQAWGDPIDFRSDIFSAGIVIYEMITGQMLYLEEDLHKLLDMARKAEIAPPSRLRKGVPPQLERIVMHALSKVPGERYQSAGDFAADLERFLHTYSPVFTAGKIAGLLKRIVGEPIQVPNDGNGGTRDPSMPSIEIRDGVMSTHELAASELEIQPEDIRDENSVIFRMDELNGKPEPVKQSAPAAKGLAAKKGPIRAVTRQAQLEPPTPQPVAPPAAVNRGQKIAAVAPGKIPSVAKPAAGKQGQKPSRPRLLDEETRQLGAAPALANDEGSGLLTPAGDRVKWDTTATESGSDLSDEELENIGERTIITGPGGVGGLGGYMMDAADGDGPVEATLITSAPAPPAGTDTDPGLDSPFENDATAEQPSHTGRTGNRAEETEDEELSDDDEGPTLSRDFVPPAPKKRTTKPKAAPPPALAAKIHAPAVSELRKPKPSRRTPPGGVPAQHPGGSVLQAIVGSQASEPMPTPRPEARTPLQAVQAPPQPAP
ncbi:MAG: serine/threonine protein kinase, partial [Deltaproteobacteria bacterium]|nr:serine/threonine protein kinase [Deltaproteobacteria bacterium]